MNYWVISLEISEEGTGPNSQVVLAESHGKDLGEIPGGTPEEFCKEFKAFILGEIFGKMSNQYVSICRISGKTIWRK